MYYLLHREDQEVSYGLNWAIAGRGVVVKDKVFYNLEKSELQKGGAAYTECLSGIPLHVRGNVISGIPDVSRAQFAKLLKLVTFHLSSISSLYVQDGAVGSSVECDAKVRVISDNPSAVLLLSNILWKTPDRSISHDTCPLTIYVASSISANVRNSLGSGSQYANGFAAADIERSSLILCGKAFADSAMLKGALSALTAPVLSARGGLPFPGWLLSFGGSAVLLFAPVDVIKSLKLQDVLVSTDSGVVVSLKGSNVLFATKAREPNLFTRPTQVIIVSSDSTDALPALSKLSPGQAAYHFLAGYCDGKFIPAYSKDPSPLDPIALANSLFSHLKEDNTPTYLINAKSSGKYIDGKEFVRLIEVLLSNNLPDRKSEDIRVGELKGKYKSFLSRKFGKYLPKEFSF
ncbi:phosphoenolpyruvate carboxykinase (ATP)-like isoform X2 [Oryza glaberrima]|uniref:phosphoenolpyruvate carboxykinase (ATP)-like isoform X2 n=1 Tax=Oryza glaberrima TaxID=4538 RepID=UPI00224C210A|nr:phosphoenolpyruvate carboxykinase (ATP)-like isoform X2 [Oryza glaberrima]